jgi:hypothetical protein
MSSLPGIFGNVYHAREKGALSQRLGFHDTISV